MPGPGLGPLGGLGLLVLIVAGGTYAAGVLALRRRGDGWPRRRCVCALAGLLSLVVVVLAPALAALLHVDVAPFELHVFAHLLTAMAAPLLLALAAPVTLALRTLPGRARRLLLAVLHSRLSSMLLHPAVVVLLDVGGMYAYYLTPLFGWTMQTPLLHLVVHLHMVTAGSLLSWYLVGTDPVPHRPTVRIRLLVLVVVAGAHDVLAKLMYAWALPMGAGRPAEVRSGARLMFYGGDLIDVALAVVLLAGWYARTGRELRRQTRRELRHELRGDLRHLRPTAALTGADVGTDGRPRSELLGGR